MPQPPDYAADRLEIVDLLTRCADAVDRRDWRLFESCFAEHATAEYAAMNGRVDIETASDWLAAQLAQLPMSQHFVTDFVLTIDGDGATCRSAFLAAKALPTYADRTDPHLQFVGGYYWDELVRTAGGWRIQDRSEEVRFATSPAPNGESRETG